MELRILTSGAVARELGISRRVIEGVLEARPDLRPELVGGRFVWGPAEVERVRQVLAERGATKAPTPAPPIAACAEVGAAAAGGPGG